MILDAYNEIPISVKPRKGEWIPMAAICIRHDDEIELISLAVGSRCLSES